MTLQGTRPVRDEIATVNERHWEWAVRKGERVFDAGPREQLDPTLRPGSWEHAIAFLPGSFAVVAAKCRAS